MAHNALPSPSALCAPEFLGSPFQLRKLLHRHSDPQFCDVDLFEAVDMGEHAAWANLDEPIYAEKDFEIYRPPQHQSSLPVYYVKGWLPYSADTLFNALTDAKYRQQWDKLAKQAFVVDRQPESGSDVIYFAMHLPWPFANRDYVYQRRTKFFARQNAFVMISQAVHHANAPEHTKGVVRVEAFTMRLSIRSTGTNSCDFYMEYEDDSNFSIPNYVVNWLLSIQVPSFMDGLRRACANYPTYVKTLDVAAVLAAPATVARRRADERHQYHTAASGAVGSPVSLRRAVLSSSSSGDQPRASMPASALLRKASSSSSSDDVTRRSLQVRSDGKSDGDLSSSPDQTRRARKFFQRHRGKDADTPWKRDVLKKTKSMNKLFSSTKKSASGAPSDPLVADDFVVEFRKQKIGLHLETDLYSNRILVAHCEKNTEAARNAVRPIEVGMVVTSVNGKLIDDVPSSDVLEGIRSASRPLSLGFSVARASSMTPRKSKEPRNMLKCTFSRDGADLLNLFKPLDGDANVGAVLKSAFEGKRVAKTNHHSPRFRDRASRTSPLSRSTSETVVIPEGAVLCEVDNCLVVNLAFAEIMHLLSRNGDEKVLSFKPGLAIVGDREIEDFKRSALSRKLSMAFRWKLGPDESPMGSSSTKTANSSFKSTSGTDSSSVMSGEITSESEEAQDGTGSTVPRLKADSKICLPDYSKVGVSARNVAWAWEHVHLLKADERTFSAAMLIEKIEAFMMKENKSDVESAVAKAVFNKMHEQREWIDQIKERRTMGVQALHEFNNEEEAEWIFGQTYFGVSTHWKPGADGTVWLKLDGLVEGVDIFNTIAVMREIDLFSCWVPFCNRSELLHKEGYVNVLAYMSMVFPLLKRDAVIRAVGINACYESRCILLLGGSVDESKLPSTIDAPRLKGWNADRLEMKAFRVLIEPITRTKGRTCIVCNIDPKCPVPKTLLNFSIKKIAGILLFLLRKEAEKIEKAMQDGSPSDHAARLRADPDNFYAWLRPLFDRWFEDQQANRLPPPIKFPRPSELDVLHEMNRSTSTASLGASFCSRTSSQGSVLSSLPSKLDSPKLDRRVSSRALQRTKSVEAKTSPASPDQAVGAGRRTWGDYLYDFGIWPYILLFIFSRVTPADSFLYVCTLKFIFTCTCTWFGVPGAYSWQTRQLKDAHRELDTLRRRCVVLAAVFDVLNSWALRVWVNWLLCYAALSHASMADCMARAPLEIRESENFWLMASAFTFATVVVGIQVTVNI